MMSDVSHAGAERRIEVLVASCASGAALTALTVALDDDSAPVRQRAVQLAAQHLSPETLVSFIGANQPITRRASAMEALVSQGRRAVPALISGANRDDTDVALFSLLTLGRISSLDALRTLTAFAVHADRKLAQGAIEGLGTLGDAAATPVLLRVLETDAWLTFGALVALGQVGDERAIGPLEKLVRHDAYGLLAGESLSLVRIRLARHGARHG
ncbi:MAG: HEAT repeat domain-containing protein [Archangium sp.]|nr:HEAT repeat domain-containing protein [Archangium sp.]